MSNAPQNPAPQPQPWSEPHLKRIGTIADVAGAVTTPKQNINNS